MGMNPTLAAMYNTHGHGDAVAEEQTKIAHLELFCKAAAAQGIDLSQLDEDTKGALFQDFTTKLAAEEGEEEEEGPEHEGGESKAKEEGEQEEGDEDEKEAAARAEYAAMSEWQEKNAQADFLGRRMAHAFWDEYNEISKEAGRAGEAIKRGREAAGKFVAKVRGKTTEMGGKHEDPALKAARKALGAKSGQAPETAMRTAKEFKRVKGEQSKARKQLAGAAAGTAAAAGAVGGGVAAARRGNKKEASAFDLTAAEQGLKIASAAGWDEEECTQRLNSLLTLGVDESEKVAYANGNFEDAVNIRGLELLEEAGYPVDWEQVFD
jgi:hypothetical protein